MTLVHHTSDAHAVYCDMLEKLQKDAARAMKKLRWAFWLFNWLFGKKTACWLRFAVVPQGITLPNQFGTPDRPYQSALTLDGDSITQELLQEGLDNLKVKGVFVGRLERRPDNPFLGIDQPYYEFTLEVRRY